MSRVGKNPVALPAGVQITVEGSVLTAKGAKGALSLKIHPSVEVQQNGAELVVVRKVDDQSGRAMMGTTRALLNNIVTGVSAGFERKLELVGVGYRAKAAGGSLNLSLGFSHPVDLAMPEGVSVETPTQTEILLKGIDKQLLGQVAAEIRSLRAPEPYKGKGIRYAGEKIRRKEAKKK